MNLLKTILSTSVFAIASVALHAQLPAKVESFPVRDVRLTASPFKHAEDMDIRYLLGIDPDRLLAPYLKEAGLSPKAENYTNWENTGLDGHIGGHYLSALSYMYAATGNKEIKARLDYMISKLKRCQDAAGDGYLCGVPNGRKMWKEIEEGNIRASGFGLNDRWVPLYNIHKIYAGLRDATLQTDSREAKEMLVKLTDWMIRLVSKLSDEQIQDMLRSEHGGLNETFADMAAITGDKRYLKLAHQFSHHTVLQPLLRQEDKLTGMHANTQIPKVIGFKRIADLEGNRDWSEGSGMENHARYGEMIYGHKDNNLYVNLFIPSTLRWGDTQIEQQTAFPDEEGSTLVISPEKGKKEFTLLFRIPEWTKPEALRLSVNGKRQNVTVKEGYVSLNRTWSKGDKVRLELPMHLRAIALPDGSANYSILYGPIVLAARLGKQNQDGMFADDSRGGHIAAGPRLPLQTMPVIVGDKNNLLSHLKKVEGKPLTFTLSGVYPERYEGMTVEPFFRLYECRYMVYWPVLSVQELQARQEQLAKEEKERAALDGMTADKVICGEQQPESDHFIRMENSRTGDDEGIHWREAAGWFSYRMKTNGKQVNKVRIRFRPEIRKDAKVWINGQEVGRLAGKPASDVSVGIFDVPASMQSNEQLEIKIGKGNEKVTPHIYEVRLVTE